MFSPVVTNKTWVGSQTWGPQRRPNRGLGPSSNDRVQKTVHTTGLERRRGQGNAKFWPLSSELWTLSIKLWNVGRPDSSPAWSDQSGLVWSGGVWSCLVWSVPPLNTSRHFFRPKTVSTCLYTTLPVKLYFRVSSNCFVVISFSSSFAFFFWCFVIFTTISRFFTSLEPREQAADTPKASADLTIWFPTLSRG